MFETFLPIPLVYSVPHHRVVVLLIIITPCQLLKRLKVGGRRRARGGCGWHRAPDHAAHGRHIGDTLQLKHSLHLLPRLLVLPLCLHNVPAVPLSVNFSLPKLPLVHKRPRILQLALSVHMSHVPHTIVLAPVLSKAHTQAVAKPVHPVSLVLFLQRHNLLAPAVPPVLEPLPPVQVAQVVALLSLPLPHPLHPHAHIGLAVWVHHGPLPVRPVVLPRTLIEGFHVCFPAGALEGCLLLLARVGTAYGEEPCKHDKTPHAVPLPPHMIPFVLSVAAGIQVRPGAPHLDL
mmetsp:Transcript_24247/g.58112  ORF Transcript_24247/g.58112 Transcript_24247/m.58112 type:complete len:289 (-) Transcript_24247:186-1052(-)